MKRRKELPTKEKVINDVMKIYEQKRYINRMLYLEKGCYHNKIINKLFGSWNNLLKEAGLPINVLRNISKEDVIEDVLRVYREEGKINKELYLKKGKYSRKPIERIWGSWNNMLKELGLPINCEINIPEEKLLEDLIRLKKEFGYCCAELIRQYGEYVMEVYIRRFGSLNEAYRRAGLEVRKPGEAVMADILFNIIDEILGEKHIKEQTFDWLRNNKTGYKLYIDAYWSKHKLCVEYNGLLHYTDETWRKDNRENDDLKARQYRDRLKEKLVRQHGLYFLIIRHDEPINKQYIAKKVFAALSDK